MAVHVSSGACNLDMQFATVWLNKFNKYFILGIDDGAVHFAIFHRNRSETIEKSKEPLLSKIINFESLK